jgi:hypothetical protein
VLSLLAGVIYLLSSRNPFVIWEESHSDPDVLCGVTAGLWLAGSCVIVYSKQDQRIKFIYREHRNVTLSKIHVSEFRLLILHYISTLREKR